MLKFKAFPNPPTVSNFWNLYMSNNHRCELIEVEDKKHWDEICRSPIFSIRAEIECLMIRLPLPQPITVYCGCCDQFQMSELHSRHARLMADGQIKFAISEAYLCPICGINSRMRFAVSMLLRSEWRIPRGGKIYLTEQKTNLFRALTGNDIDCTGSEWLGVDKESGRSYDGVRHEDIHHLSFKDESFDAVLSLDVLEHVEDPFQAALELFRVLRKGGIGILTFPFYPTLSRTRQRARVLANGSIENILPPVYHGNPLGGGSLLINELSWDYLERIRSRFGSAVAFYNYWSLYEGHFGTDRFCLMLRK
jgi:SAM-dependent methyltransferase